MIEHLLHDYQHWLFMWWGGGLLFVAFLVSFGYAVWTRRQRERQERDVTDLLGVSDLSNSLNTTKEGKSAGRSVDTVFILPDISNYTRFVSSKHLQERDAQDVVFSLMSAIINMVGDDLQFSKLEGDSALFFTNSAGASPQKIGGTICAIFDAFDARKSVLKSEQGRSLEVQDLIASLELKMFVHRGVAQRFTYRNMVDHFGAEVTLLHKLMKNRVSGNRYVLVTKPARTFVDLDRRYSCEPLRETVEHIGPVDGCVFRPSVRAETTGFQLNSPKTNPSQEPAVTNLPTRLQIDLNLTNKKWNMKMKLKPLVAALAVTLAATAAFAADYTKGTIKKIDEKSGKITVKHEELKNLDMPAMTMVFRAKDEAMLGKLKEGDDIEFVAERVKGKLTLVELK